MIVPFLKCAGKYGLAWPHTVACVTCSLDMGGKPPQQEGRLVCVPHVDARTHSRIVHSLYAR